MEIAAGNALVGGATAAVSAMFRRQDPIRAFIQGVGGGLVHAGGKVLATSPRAALNWPGVVMAGVGTSIVYNAGRGAHLLEEISVPAYSLRLRYSRQSPRRFHVVLNALETAVAIRTWSREGIALDWTRSSYTGTPMFEGGFMMDNEGNESAGEALGSTAIVSRSATDFNQTVRHEVAHVHQFWFVQDAWGRPLEDALRRSTVVGQWLPGWLEIGLAGPVLVVLANRADGGSVLRAAWEGEAERLERRERRPPGGPDGVFLSSRPP